MKLNKEVTKYLYFKVKIKEVDIYKKIVGGILHKTNENKILNNINKTNKDEKKRNIDAIYFFVKNIYKQ